MENDYQFFTIHTLIDIGDGKTALLDDDGSITPTANLSRIVDTILRFAYPFMTTVSSCVVDLSKDKNKSYYRLSSEHNDNLEIFTFKFAVKSENILHELVSSLDNVPVVISNHGFVKFQTSGTDKNTTIIQNKIS